MSYAKAHPFGYKPVKQKDIDNKHFREVQTGLQKIVVKSPYKVIVRDSQGKHIMNGKEPVTETFFNTYVRTVKLYAPKQRKGRTLAEMVYENLKV